MTGISILPVTSILQSELAIGLSLGSIIVLLVRFEFTKMKDRKISLCSKSQSCWAMKYKGFAVRCVIVCLLQFCSSTFCWWPQISPYGIYCVYFILLYPASHPNVHMRMCHLKLSLWYLVTTHCSHYQLVSKSLVFRSTPPRRPNEAGFSVHLYIHPYIRPSVHQ